MKNQSGVAKSSTASQTDSQPATDRRIPKLLATFAAMYGARYPEHWDGIDQRVVRAVWAKGLAPLADREIAEGLDRLIRKGKPFPPSLPEFFGLCRPPIAIPPANDHHGIERLASRLGITASPYDSYESLRRRLIERLETAAPQQAAITDETATS